MTFGSDLLDRQEEIERYGEQGNEMLPRFAEYLRKRASLSEDYYRGLQKLNKQLLPTLPYEFGIVELLATADRTISAHQAFVSHLQDTLIDAVKSTMKEHDKQRREALTKLKDLRSEWKVSMNSFEKVKKSKDTAIRSAEEARQHFEKVNVDRHVTKAQVDKSRDDYSNKARKTLLAKEEYIQAAREIKEKQRILYDEELPTLFDQLQQLEERRVNKMRSHLVDFTVILVKTLSEEVTGMKDVHVKFEKIVPCVVIQQFIDAVRSGDSSKFQYPETITLDETASVESFGILQNNNNISSKSRGDPESISTRLGEIEKELTLLEKQKDGVIMLSNLYKNEPGLSDAKTKTEASKQLSSITEQIENLNLERHQLGSRLETASTKSQATRKSSYASPVAWDGDDQENINNQTDRVRVLYDFEASNPNVELTVKCNEVLTLISRDGGEWWQVRNASGRTGYVPYNYVEEL